MKEQLISLETYTLAKEKGFNIKSCVCGGFPECLCGDRSPSQSFLQKWLREQSTPIIVVPETDFIAWTVYISHPDLNIHIIYRDPETKFYIDSYERALELGLQYGLTLIP